MAAWEDEFIKEILPREYIYQEMEGECLEDILAIRLPFPDIYILAVNIPLSIQLPMLP